jgi:hypothetical protein
LGYTPDWELLAHALKRVVASGVARSQDKTEAQAKTEICQAIADRKIGIRVLMQKAALDVGGKILVGGNVEVPPRLDPVDFDWDKSRPFKPWNTGPDDGIPAERYFATWPWKPRSIEWIELSTADVVEILCGGGAAANNDPLAQTQLARGERRLAWLRAVNQETESEKVPTAGPPRPLNERTAKRFAADYIDREKKAGKHPTMAGLEAAAKEANRRGGREFLRAAFKQILGAEVTRGRPRNSPTKSAKK